MAYPKEILDGSMATGTLGDGSGTVTINSVVYIVESETLTPNWTEATRRNSGGRINGSRHIKQPFTLVLKLQLATSSTPYPPSGTRFNYTPKQTGVGLLSFFVLEVPEERTNEDSFIESATITCREVTNSGNFTVVTS